MQHTLVTSSRNRFVSWYPPFLHPNSYGLWHRGIYSFILMPATISLLLLHLSFLHLRTSAAYHDAR
jgi:hypothetical protein